MNCYLVEIRFLRPFESFGKIVAEHRTYLQQAYDQGLLLLSGPRQDGKGDLCIARASSEAVLREFFAHDPYRREGLAEHHFVPFLATKYQAILESWLAEKPCAF